MRILGNDLFNLSNEVYQYLRVAILYIALPACAMLALDIGLSRLLKRPRWRERLGLGMKLILTAAGSVSVWIIAQNVSYRMTPNEYLSMVKMVVGAKVRSDDKKQLAAQELITTTILLLECPEMGHRALDRVKALNPDLFAFGPRRTKTARSSMFSLSEKNKSSPEPT
jgi:hypothetical protein